MFLQGFILALGFLAGLAACYVTYTVLSIWLQGLKIKRDINEIGKRVLEEAKANGTNSEKIRVTRSDDCTS